MKAKIIGTGSFLPSKEVDNKQLLDFLGVKKGADWVEEKIGIKTRRLDYDFSTDKKTDNGFFDSDIAEKAARQAISEAKISADEIDCLIHVTCTPDKLHFTAGTIELRKRLGLKKSARHNHIDSGCAGLSQGFDLVKVFIESMASKVVLLVASNSCSSFIDKDRYMRTRTWLSPVIFGDGAAAAVFIGVDDDKVGLLDVFYEVDPSHPLIDFKGGGALFPSTDHNLDDHTYNMNAREVGEVFPVAMARNFNILKSRNGYYSMSDFKRYYFHQANRWFVEEVAKNIGVPIEKVGINVDKYGNTSAASTLILFDEDRKNNLIRSGDLVLFLWVGAGMVIGGAVLKV